ncbi:hypothetical protein OOK29_25890 [Streptomyces phaeochromogenes]|uniref:hypothetical protein n=1 Tax=Streptomyces phaeochromogenes TaxID=1923 RepID=UPI0022502ED0|nr:hypothetical protein [Streptomyces phaeochromogenes]MCX5601586.1 hypothetical protein [Streptomyces phaeochromogenes]
MTGANWTFAMLGNDGRWHEVPGIVSVELHQEQPDDGLVAARHMLTWPRQCGKTAAAVAARESAVAWGKCVVADSTGRPYCYTVGGTYCFCYGRCELPPRTELRQPAEADGLQAYERHRRAHALPDWLIEQILARPPAEVPETFHGPNWKGHNAT